MWNSDFLGGRLITTDEGERQREIERLKRKYADVIQKYAEFRAEYPYTVRKAREILARRERYKGKRNEADPNDDIVYPELSDLSHMSPVQASDMLVSAAKKTVANNRRRIVPTLVSLATTAKTSPDTTAVFRKAYDEGRKRSKRDKKLLRDIEKTRNMSVEELDKRGMKELHKFLEKVESERATNARVKGFFN